MKKITAVILAMILTFSLFAISASAEEVYDYSSSAMSRSVASQTSIFSSSAATTDTWKTESTKTITSSYDDVYGGDVGTYFHMSNVGLSSAFIKDTSRKAYGKLYEDDVISTELVWEYTHYFGTYNGYYRPVSVSYTYTTSDKIESDSVVELFYYHKVASITGDTSRNVPSGLQNYQFWAD